MSDNLYSVQNDPKVSQATALRLLFEVFLVVYYDDLPDWAVPVRKSQESGSGRPAHILGGWSVSTPRFPKISGKS